MKYARLIHAFYASPWAILPAKLAELREFLAVKAAGEDIDPEEIKAAVSSRRRLPLDVSMAGHVAVLPIFGIIAQRVSPLEASSGGISTEAIGATLDGLVADKAVKSILLVFDSPGGSVPGVPELASKIRDYRGLKKIDAFADSMAASAAYWLASQTQEITITPSGEVGSIGVLAAHTDISEAEKKAGVKTTLIVSSAHKAETAPYYPLSDEATAELQSKVNYFGNHFIADVAKGRGVTANRVATGFGQGRMFTAEQAMEAGMVDRIATLEQVLETMGAFERTGPSAQAAMARARALELESDLA